jgi:uncharacterized membrane protein SirB2
MSDFYHFIKQMHMLFAVISLLGFLARSGMKFSNSALLNNKIVKVLPHVNDTLLLLCGVSLAVIAGLNPVVQFWLGAKLFLLLVYIACGMFVLKWSTNNLQRIFGIFVALSCFAGMGMLAVAKPF